MDDPGDADAAPRRQSLSDAAFSGIVERIMDGSLEPGEALRMRELQELLGVSQTPLRESLAKLEGQGLVVRTAMKGFTVAPPLGRPEVEKLMRVRELLEPEIAAQAARNATEAQIADLLHNVERSRATTPGPRFAEYREYLDLSADFHNQLGRASANRFLRTALAALPVHVQRFRLFGPSGVSDVDVSLGEHERIARAVAARDVRKAREAMQRHIRGVGGRAVANVPENET